MRNPPAFPLYRNFVDISDQKGVIDSQGMSLRDYFASMALPMTMDNAPSTVNTIAKRAYQIADAMLKERERAEV